MEITLIEHQNVLSLFIQDNGSKKDVEHKSGMGLLTMQEFADEYGGQCNYGFSARGFYIHLRIQKEKI